MVSSSEMSVLQIIILIFTILSLICLFLIFITYCLFEQLRTLPGKNNMCLVIALFFAMAFLEFGSSWVIQIVDSFLPLSFFSIIVSLLNALQGVYIFVAYIFNKRVFILYRSLICYKPVVKFGSESRNVTKN
ncbi:uncharacterized protein LOC127702770 [Mytilus californianus]|uniref:uncharacterized protein LOC127702770 n=1 Tax=Mytilus californianus TaxID=6549 RepID=UPI0022466BEC|nr:uncharacterized protein LOC127702770 [Mytilus californianus]